MTTTTNRWAGFGGQTREIDTRTVDIDPERLACMDDAVLHFASVQNKKQLETTFPGDVHAAEEFASQLRGYAAANGVTLSSCEQDGDVVSFRFAKTRTAADGTRVDDPDAEDDTEEEPQNEAAA